MILLDPVVEIRPLSEAKRLVWPAWARDVDRYPADGLGDHEHTHQAIDDARGYAHLLVTLMSKSGPA
jgi:hypothetical protein